MLTLISEAKKSKKARVIEVQYETLPPDEVDEIIYEAQMDRIGLVNLPSRMQH